MIGVISWDSEKEIATEFFELFKTPWEFYHRDRFYDVVVSTRDDIVTTNSKLTIMYVSEKNHIEPTQGIRVQSEYRKRSVERNGITFPIYGHLFTFEGKGQAVLRAKDTSEVTGVEVQSSGAKIILLGYNLFEEIYFLLSEGQPKENAHIPTIEIHISLLRDLILTASIPLIEVPPVPAGYDFITCLSHDIDFLGIRHHKLDHTMWGFLYRASVGSLVRGFKGKLPLQKLIKNWKAVLSLPLVYTGLSNDFWSQIDKYVEIEKDMKSTFFLIPFKDKPGDNMPKHRARRRAAKYDISDMEGIAKKLVDQGFEIGVHGIDAWHSVEKARQEFNRIIDFCKGSEIGIRIHWLYFNNNSYGILEEAGFTYDSTFGYNDAVGYRAGTGQVFKPFHAKNVFELPLHIQDTALFYPQRMNLSEEKAMRLCKKLFQQAKSYGGVLTILWHDRSLAPERLWGDFYINLLTEIKESKVWFATAGEIVNWFRKRREVIFEKVDIDSDKIRLSLKYASNDSGRTREPFVFARIHHPKFRNPDKQNPSLSSSGYIDLPLKGETLQEVSLDDFNSQPVTYSLGNAF